MKALHEELSNLDGGRVLGEDDSATELDSYTYSPSPAPGMDDNGGFLDESGRSYSNLSTKDVEELQRVRVAVPEGEEDDAALSDFDSDISDDETGTEGVDASSVMEGAMAGGTHAESPARVGGVTLEDIDDLKKSAYELENEFKFDFADNVMPSFVEKKDKDDAVFEKLMKENEGGGGGGGGISGPIPTPYRRKPVQFNCFDGLIADLKEFLGATPFIWLYLLLLGIITAVIGGMMDWAIIYCHRLRYYLARAPHNYWEDWFMWGSTTLFFTALAIAACQLSPVAQGSGIPEIKCILSGVKLKGLLSFKTLMAKVLSLTFGLSSGLMIGKKGPFVHVSSMIANLLSKVRPFHLIRENPQLYQQMIAVGCGMGVSSNFGAPIGGVLFSIEVTSTYYPVRNYLLTFQCAVISAIAYQFVSWQSATAPTNFPRDCWVYTELVFHGALGVVCGLGSAALVKLICQIILKRRWFAGTGGPGKGSAFLVWRAKIVKWLSHPYVYSLWVILGTAIITFPGNYYFMSLPGLSSLKEMIWLGPLDTRPGGAKDWDTHFPIVVSILLFTLSRFFGLAFSASMPIACGLYAPALIVGAGLGRATGELLKDVFPDGLAFFPQDKVYEILPATYAVIGASAFAAGMSHTLSSAIIIMEITGQMHLLSPIILATSIAFMVSRAFTPSIYDAVTKIKGLPYLPDLEHSMFDMTADDIMERNPLSIPINASPPKVAKIMRKYKDKPTFPVIDAEESRMLLGFVKRKDLIRWLVISTTEPSDGQSTDFEVSDPGSGGLAGAAAAMLGPLTRRKRRRSHNKRRVGQKKGQQGHSSDEEYVMGNRGTVAGRRATGLGEGLGEGEGRHLVGKTYGTFWGREDKGLGSNLPMISEEEALRRVSEKERAGAPAASRLTDIFELKEDTEMPIFKKPPKPAPHAAGPGMMGVASNTPRPMMGGGAVVAPVGSPTTTTTTAGDADGAVGSGQGGGGSPVGGLEGLRRRSSSTRGAPGELRRRTSSLAALVAGAAAGGAAGGAVSASGEIRQLYPNRPPLPVIPVPIQILDEMPMPYVHMLFITLKLSDAYVTKKGRLNGLISRETLKQVIDRHKDPMEVFLMQEGLAFKDSWKWNLHQCYRKWRR